MIEEENENIEDLNKNIHSEEEVITKVTGMYKDWFLDYASYVILERAVPAIGDGLKPVQRRIMHSLKEKDDGRYNKVANIVGHTMQYHPHGDMSIADAMVQIGQKELLIDTQGNWGNILTGDREELLPYFASHKDVNAIIYCGDNLKEIETVEEMATENLKRVSIYKRKNWEDEKSQSPYFIEKCQEIKTIWHPTEV